jgi:5-methylcytosine-specific restriction enzyme subunit McrC
MIPIRNLYFLLAYAWEFFPEGASAPQGIEDCPDSLHLLAHLLAEVSMQLAVRPSHREYRVVKEETARLRGRVRFSESLSRFTWLNGRVICAVDELDHDTLPNQVIGATLARLQEASLERGVQRSVAKARLLWPRVTPISLTSGVFRKVRLHRHQARLRLALRFCELLHELSLPSPQGRRAQFTDLQQDDLLMNRLFEAFVRNYLRRHLHQLGAVRCDAMRFPWQGKGLTEAAQALLPTMLTDVTLTYENGQALILDCKYYTKVFSERGDRQRLYTGNLYQMLAYLQNYAPTMPAGSKSALLLYPLTSGEDFTHPYQLLGYRLTAATLNLNETWQAIAARLRELTTAELVDVEAH